jgi:Predicted nucleic-acid-binding protein implicated in transcription termination
MRKKRSKGLLVKKCLASEEYGNREDMLRFVVSPEGVLTLDLAEKLPTRGIWFKSDRKTLSNITKAKHFINRKYGRQGAKMPFNLPAVVEEVFIKRLKDLFGLCAKAKVLEVGFKKTEAALKAGKELSAIILASDASAASVDGLLQGDLAADIKTFSFLSIEELSDLAGEKNCACIGLIKGSLTKTLARDIMRYELFRGKPEENEVNSTDTETINSNLKAD